MTDNHHVKIRCPQCGDIQDAIVECIGPFMTCIHICTNCGYAILEDEWDEVETKTEEQ